MKRKLSPWCKEVKKTLIDRDMSVTELCGEVVLPYSLIRTSSVALSPSFPLTVRSITNSTPIVPPVIWPRILFVVSVI